MKTFSSSPPSGAGVPIPGHGRLNYKGREGGREGLSKNLKSLLILWPFFQGEEGKVHEVQVISAHISSSN